MENIDNNINIINALKNARANFNQNLTIEPPKPSLMTDDEANMNSFVLPILIKHPHINFDERTGHFFINENAYTDLNEKEQQDLKNIDLALFSRYRISNVEGLEGKAYIIEECDTKTGHVLSKTMYLNSNVHSEDIPNIQLKSNQLGVSHVATETRQVGMMLQNNQLDLIKEQNQPNVQVLSNDNSMRTKYGLILTGLSLITLRDMLNKDKLLEQQKLKNFLIKIRQKKKKKETINRTDEYEAEELEIKNAHKQLLFHSDMLNSHYENTIENHVVELEDRLAKSVQNETVNLINSVGEQLNIDTSDIVNEINNGRYANVFNDTLSSFVAMGNIIKEEFQLNNNMLVDLYQERLMELQQNDLTENHENNYKYKLNNALKLNPDF